MSVCRRSFSIFIPLVLLFLIGSLRLAQAQTSADPSLRLVVDTPGRTATVETPFLIAGWALDLRSVSGPNIDAIHVWAFPVNGAPIFIGAATLNGPRADVAGVFGAQFQSAGFSLMSTGTLRPG